MKRTSNHDVESFGYKHLQQSGWVEGRGLGKKGAGGKDPIKVNLKHDTAGLGHDSGREFTNQWWDHVFNKAAAKVSVATDGSGTVTVSSQAVLSEEKKKKLKSKVLYGNFIKGATLVPDKDIREPNDDVASQSSGLVPTASALPIPTLSDEQLLKACGGRTAHKGARHGFKMNGKLARLEQQDSQIINGEVETTLTSDLTTPDSRSIHKKKKKKKSRDGRLEDYDLPTNDQEHTSKNKRLAGCLNVEDFVADTVSLVSIPECNSRRGKKKKFRKSKDV